MPLAPRSKASDAARSFRLKRDTIITALYEDDLCAALAANVRSQMALLTKAAFASDTRKSKMERIIQ